MHTNSCSYLVAKVKVIKEKECKYNSGYHLIIILRGQKYNIFRNKQVFPLLFLFNFDLPLPGD